MSGYLRSDFFFVWHSPLRHSLHLFRRLTPHCHVDCASQRAIIKERPFARTPCAPGLSVEIYVLFMPTED